MDWIERLNEAIRYIEENLTGEIEYENSDKLPVALRIIFKECLRI